ncbi:Asp23/Gls24 family envelope stress response protein [Streptomyces sp. NBC_01190]|uniref:Asp23/Gls24 family envelope stress response protein n=1 Tax=Streptomyces sp. NBC_01190 TaxID=2903767 RepID=UPI00386DED2D|nr:alkaline shock response membrane anchor protein AmaP [Streptomyces sp. NBC_01190]
MTAAVPTRTPAGDRGSLRIADRAIARIAAHAAGEALADAPGAELVPRAAAPQASVSVRRNTARLRITVELGYPVDLGSVSQTVRRHVVRTVEALTGMGVPEVAVEIERLHSVTARRKDEGRVR